MLAASSAVIDLVSVDGEEEKKHVAVSPPPKKRKSINEKEDDVKPTTNSNHAWTCPLCFDGFGIEGFLPCVLTSCGHMFCATCILSCPKNNCPLCRMNFKKENILPLRELMKTDDAIAQATFEVNFDVKNASSSSSSVRVAGEEIFSASVQLSKDLQNNHIFTKLSLVWRIETSFMKRLNLLNSNRIPYDAHQSDRAFGPRESCLRAHYLIGYLEGAVVLTEARSFCVKQRDVPYFDSLVFPKGQKKEERRSRLNKMYRALEPFIVPFFHRAAIRIEFKYYDETIPIERSTKFYYFYLNFSPFQ